MKVKKKSWLQLNPKFPNINSHICSCGKRSLELKKTDFLKDPTNQTKASHLSLLGSESSLFL